MHSPFELDSYLILKTRSKYGVQFEELPKSKQTVAKVTFRRPFSIYRSVGFVIQLFFVLGFIIRIETFFT